MDDMVTWRVAYTGWFFLTPLNFTKFHAYWRKKYGILLRDWDRGDRGEGS